MEWVLDKWYKKVIYVIGWVYLALMTYGFVIGVIEGATSV